jgi:hypothetical protein
MANIVGAPAASTALLKAIKDSNREIQQYTYLAADAAERLAEIMGQYTGVNLEPEERLDNAL